MGRDIRVRLIPEPPLKVDFNNKLVLKYVEPNHAKLENLDYEHSGHTGFMPAKVSLLPEVSQDVQNERLVLSIYDSQTQSAGSIAFDDLRKRIIKTDDTTTGSQKGQYIFLEIKED